jgi:hypothetical protein
LVDLERQFDLSILGEFLAIDVQDAEYVTIHAASPSAAFSTGIMNLGWSPDGTQYVAFSTPLTITAGAPSQIGIDVYTKPVPYLMLVVATAASEKVDIHICKKKRT